MSPRANQKKSHKDEHHLTEGEREREREEERRHLEKKRKRIMIMIIKIKIKIIINNININTLVPASKCLSPGMKHKLII